MNIKDLPQGSYTIEEPQTMNINDLQQGSYTVESPEAEDQFNQAQVGLAHSQGLLDKFLAPQPTGESPYNTGNMATSPILSYEAGQSPLGVVAKAVVNTPTSIIRLANNLLDPRTYIGLGKATAGGIQSIPGISDFYNHFSKGGGANPQLQSNREAFHNFVDGLEQQYGSIENIKRSIAEDPAGTALVVRGLMEGGAGIASKTGFGKTAELLKKTGRTIVPIKKVVSGAGNLYDMISGKVPPKNIDAFITKNFEKGVRPSVSGKGTATQAQAYTDKSIQAVKTIVDNKANLQLADEFGELTGQLPQTLKQFADAIDQTKKQVFSQYNVMAKAAGEEGAKIDLISVGAELGKIADSPVIQDLHPEVAKYAINKADAFSKRLTYSAEDAQTAIENLNRSLEAFYRNPSYEAASRASVDALIANKLRTGLDKIIEKTTGEGYRGLKNQYGSLKTIEKDVVHRSIVDARKNAKGLIDFSNIISAGEVIKGLTSMSAGDITGGLAIKAASTYYKYLNNPNTAIKRLFSGLEKAKSSSGTIK